MIDDIIEGNLFSLVFDVTLILIAIYGAFNWPIFAGGFEWFLVLGLSPRAWR